MDDAERQRTMDFILRQQAQFAAGMQRLEEQQAQVSRQSEERLTEFAQTLKQLGGIVVGMARQFRRDRADLRERIAALVDAQMRSEERQSRSEEWQALWEERQARSEERQARSEEWQARMEEGFARSEARMTRLEKDAGRTRKDLAALTHAVESHDNHIRALAALSDRNREDIAALARVVADMTGRRNGGDGGAGR